MEKKACVNICKAVLFVLSGMKSCRMIGEIIREHLVSLCEKEDLRVIFTVGGTGVRPTDWAPEATRDVIEKEIPGIGEAMRAESLKKMRTAMLSRGTAGIRGKTLVVNLPGSPKGSDRQFGSIASDSRSHRWENIGCVFRPRGERKANRMTVESIVI